MVLQKVKLKLELKQNIQFEFSFRQKSADDHEFVQNESGLHPTISGPLCGRRPLGPPVARQGLHSGPEIEGLKAFSF